LRQEGSTAAEEQHWNVVFFSTCVTFLQVMGCYDWCRLTGMVFFLVYLSLLVWPLFRSLRVWSFFCFLYGLSFASIIGQVKASTCSMAAEGQGMKQVLVGLVAVPLLFVAQAANAITSQQVRSLTYEEVKGTGLANRCTELPGTNGEISISDKSKYKIADLCFEPKSFQIEQEVSRRKGGVTKGEFKFLWCSSTHANFLKMQHNIVKYYSVQR